MLDIIKAAFGVNPADFVFALVERALRGGNDAKTDAEFKRLTEDILLQVVKEWETFKQSEWPTEKDVMKGLLRFHEAHERARNHKKRRLLFTAMFNSFRPEFYAEGLAEILWAKLERLEYPDFVFLEKVTREADPDKRLDFYTSSQGGPGKWRGDQHPIFEHSEEAEYAERLARENLVGLESKENSRVILVTRKGLCVRMRDFALKEVWDENASDGSASEPTPTDLPPGVACVSHGSPNNPVVTKFTAK